MPDRPIPAACLDLIHEFEKGPSGSFAATHYIDEGRPCIGWGHNILSKADPLLNQTITLEQADALAVKDLAQAGAQVQFYLDVPDKQYPSLDGKLSGSLTDGQFAALVDFVFNLGPVSFSTSTLRGKIIAGDMDGAAGEFPKWVYARDRTGKEVKRAGLAARRDAEMKLWSSAPAEPVAG